MNRVVEFLKEAGVFYLATVEGDKPRVRPFGAVAEIEGKIYFCTSNKKSCYAQIEKNPNVEFSATAQGGRWIRLEGKLVRDESIAAKEAFLEENKDLRAMYSPEDGNFEVLYLQDAVATFCSFTTAPEIVKL